MDMAGREDLVNALGLNSVLFTLTRVLGPALAGLLLYYLRPWVCFLANALSYLAVLWALASMDIAASARTEAGNQSSRPLIDGFHFLARRRELLFLILLAEGTAVFGWPLLVFLAALAAQKTAGPRDRCRMHLWCTVSWA